MSNQQPQLRTLEELHNVRAALALEWRKTELELQMHQANAEMFSLRANQPLVASKRMQSPAHLFQSTPLQRMPSISSVSHAVPVFQQRKPPLSRCQSNPQAQVPGIPNTQALPHTYSPSIPHGQFLSLRFNKWDVLESKLRTRLLSSSGKAPQRPPPTNVDPCEYLQDRLSKINDPQPGTDNTDIQQSRKRSASFEITDERPQQRPCLEIDPQHQSEPHILPRTCSTVMQEPDSESMFVKQQSPMDIRQNEDDDSQSRHAQNKITPRPNHKAPSPLNSVSLHSSPSSTHSNSLYNTSTSTGATNSHREPLTRTLLKSRSSNTSTLRPRLRPLPPQSTYYVAEYASLSNQTKRALELRYCAHIARMLASKSCVSDPPMPLASENLWERMRRRLRRAMSRTNHSTHNSRADEGKDGHDGDQIRDRDQVQDLEHEAEQDQMVYMSAIDFERDVRSMLMEYVRMGPCSNGRCPYARSGNSKVMCWRMRLEPVLDEKMRGLRRCLKECEQGFAVGDEIGMKGWVDSWFAGDFGVIKDEVE